MADQAAEDFILGIDLGAKSLGWAIVGVQNASPCRLIRTGVRIFESAMDGNLESGREESRNRARREARLHRRQVWRRARRMKKIFHLLQRFELLPQGPSATPLERQDQINELDRQILQSEWFEQKKRSGLYPAPEQVHPYILRAAALDEPLQPCMLGRALYHLAQRRGFQSNRKQLRRAQQEEEGVVKKAISDLSNAIETSGARTLGEYLARLSPFDARIRGERRWTGRSMYTIEFNQIWDAQAAHHPDLLSQERKKLLSNAIFYQRPMKFDRNIIGRCDLEPDQQRAPAYLLLSQRFRLLDKVNSLRVLPNGQPERALTADERARLIHELETAGDLKFDQLRKLFALHKQSKFNLEAGGETKIPGNRTSSQLYEVLGAQWLEMSPDECDRIVDYLHGFQKQEKIAEAAKKKWSLDDESAEKFAAISLEPDYMSLSRKAMQKLMPLLESGIPLATARKQIYPESFASRTPLELLPRVKDFGEIRNPAVMRSLTELRKVVNAIIREHGKPPEIHVELARELKKPKWLRERISIQSRENERARAKARERIIQATGDSHPSRDDIRRVLLFDECRGHCVYCGLPIPWGNFFGPDSHFHVDHIIPFSLSMDDSFPNLVLCHASCNAEKGNRPLFDAFSAERLQEIIQRVRQFTGDESMKRAKLRRFSMNHDQLAEYLAEWKDRYLNDTAYSSRLARNYLGLLYGGTVDAEHRLRVVATSGQATADLRNEWKLNGILNDGSTSNGGAIVKTRDDHRHHAVDAVAIALTSPATIQLLSDAAQRAPNERRKRFASIAAPWADFVPSVREQIDKIVVSHRVSKKVSGALHEETIYSRRAGRGQASGVRKTASHVRKPLSALSNKEVLDIVDPAVRLRVVQKLEVLGGDPKKFSEPENLPYMPSKRTLKVPIKRVRIRKAVPTFDLGTGRASRAVASDSNHHIEIYASIDNAGKETQWDGEVVPLHEAYRRKAERKSIVQRDHGELVAFKFSLAPGEVIECDVSKGKRALYVYRKATVGALTMGFAPLHDARQAREMQTSRAWLWSTPNRLRERNTRKIALSPLGELSEAHD